MYKILQSSGLLCLVLSTAAFANDWTLQTGSARQTLLQTALNNANNGISVTDRNIKYQKMADSPFIFYRGTAHLYYQDLNQQQMLANSDFNTSQTITWIQGDMHIQNYGAFDDDNGTVIFDLNDFDEAWVDSYLYDIYRASASLILVAREQGFNDATSQQQIVDAFSEMYLDTVDSYRNNNDEKDAQVKESNAYGLLDDFLADVEADNSREKMLDKWSYDAGSQRYFDLSHANLQAVTSAERHAVANAISQYYLNISSGLQGNHSYFAQLDIARRVNAGTGSLGTERFYVLIEGSSTSDNNDRILDVKKQGLPSVFPYLSASSQQNLLHEFSASEQGCRVVEAQKAMLTDVDDHLGCTVINGDSYSVRERSPFKESFDTTDLTSMTRFTKLAEQWGQILATAHSRADADHDANFVPYQFEDVMDSVADHRHAEFRAEVYAFAKSYAAQVEADYQLFTQLFNSGGLN